ncbi:sigma-54 dependent transcriptional regulator [Arenibacter sp. GZD96]|uniref:sigma-54-dependent transcriptional regulator n=1 Tax=Aurantibrevibacter litoralis TaxID=3106030 RepID=UPI002AFDE9C2|nr:sigma-54 dependent transcriptional regulator [Arenibacter sp. GZD-96]MEA1787550.1 sigma-54 dependent transcriptional regulator [Arenibacter sp. GZD-96]
MAFRKENILIVDDDINILELVQRHLQAMNYHTYKAVSVKEAVSILKDSVIDVLITDLKMPEVDGFQLIKYASEHYPTMPILVVTGFPTLNKELEETNTTLKMDYLIKPFTREELKLALDGLLNASDLEQTNDKRKVSLHTNLPENSFGELIGTSTAFKKITEIIDRVKDNRATILIRGESGTGKELVARAIHYSGKFSRAPFIAVNCGAIPENLLEAELFGYEKGAFTGAQESRNGFFQAAHHGTIFLDEIGNAPLQVQTGLLRVLQEKEVTRVGSQKTERVEVRVVAATNSDLENLITQKLFRADLFYRLSVVEINVPPLRQRKLDIPLLVEKFLQKYGMEYKDRILKISSETMAILKRYDWPGNIRELENVIQRAVIMCDKQIEVQHLPDTLKFEINFPKETFVPLRIMERNYIKEVLSAYNNNKTKAAEILQIDRKTLRQKLDETNG